MRVAQGFPPPMPVYPECADPQNNDGNSLGRDAMKTGAGHDKETTDTWVLDGLGGLQDLIDALLSKGFQVVGPRVANGAVDMAPMTAADQLPVGMVVQQDAGTYRLMPSGDGQVFRYGAPARSCKPYFYPARERLFKAHKKGLSADYVEDAVEMPPTAYLGVRPCDLNAVTIQDNVFDSGDFTDPRYAERRQAAFTVVADCTRAGGTCFCASMGSGPRAEAGFDLALTEFTDGEHHRFLVRAGSANGVDVMARLDARSADAADMAAADKAITAAAQSMGRVMVDGVAALLRDNLESPHWDDVAARCLACGNCTLVCPTCFCSAVEDTTNLTGEIAERWRAWDSCFSLAFSYIHGGSVREDGASRYRQWITHKLSFWEEQFGVSGCVGCGRCITWCPVGIDITEEARAIRAAMGGTADGSRGRTGPHSQGTPVL